MIIEPLTARELEVLRFLARGLTYTLIADQLRISEHTVTTHIKNTYRKLDVHNGRGAVLRGAQLGLLTGLDGSPDHGMGGAPSLAYSEFGEDR